jgi:hypothetical protein
VTRVGPHQPGFVAFDWGGHGSLVGLRHPFWDLVGI